MVKTNTAQSQTQQQERTPNIEAQLRAQLADMQRQLAEAKAASAAKVTLKAGPAGTVCIYGLGKKPIVAYAEQWLKVLDMSDTIRAFIKAGLSDKLGPKGGSSLSHGKADSDRFAEQKAKAAADFANRSSF